MKEFLKKYLVGIIALFHLIGLGIFFAQGSAPSLSYLTISITAILVYFSEEDRMSAIIPLAIILVCGFNIELIGVQTGYLFGSYTYTDAMGPKVLGTPILIGFSWYGVVAGASSISRNIAASILSRALIAAILTVLMDGALEHAAQNYGLWAWEGDIIPWFNYLCWFVFSFVFAYIYLYFSKGKNRIAAWVYVIWLVFFLILATFNS